MSLSDGVRLTTLEVDFTTSLITAAQAALITYDYILTVRQEACLFWKREVNASSILFFANRYLAVVYYVALYYYRTAFLPYPDIVDIGAKYLEYLPWAVFSALRVYALSQKNWFLASFTFFWAILAMPVDYYGDFHHRTFIIDPVIGCTSGASTPSFLSDIGTIFIRGGQTIADVVVIGVTWKAAYEARREGTMSSLLRILFKNGTLYFIVMLLLNILHIVFIFLPNSIFHVPLTNSSYVVWISEPITAILVSHFMLDLHETHQALAHGGSNFNTIQIMSVDIGHPYSNDRGPEELEEWSVASNSTSSHIEPDSWLETEELPRSPITLTNGHAEIV